MAFISWGLFSISPQKALTSNKHEGKFLRISTRCPEEVPPAPAAFQPIFNTGNLTVCLKKKTKNQNLPSLTRGEIRRGKGREAPALCGHNNKTLTSVKKSCAGRTLQKGTRKTADSQHTLRASIRQKHSGFVRRT